MRVVIDATTLPKPGEGGAGVEHYTRAMVEALPRAGSRHRFFSVRPLGTVPFVSRHVLIPAQAMMRRADLLFAPAGHMPLGWRGKSVVFVHDAAIYEHPEWFAGLGSQDFSVKVMVPQSLERADQLIVPSHATREQVERVFPNTAGKISVVPHGVHVPTDLALGTMPKSDTIAFVGTIEPRKNLGHAIRAFERFLEMHPERAATTSFVLAGRVGWHAEEVLADLGAINARWRARAGRDVIRQVGMVTEQEKWSLLRQASALLFPSWWEGFGLPVLEAMAVGTPVITSTRGALPEAGGDAALYVEPDDVEQMTLAIAQCLLLPEAMQEIVETGKRRAAEFTWDRSAKETIRVFEAVMKSKTSA